MKRAIAILLTFFLVTVVAFSDPQISRTVTLVTGTPVRITNNHVQANSIFIQMLHGGSNIGYVLFADPAVACNTATVGQTVAELAPASANAPGGSFVFPSNAPSQSGSGGTDTNFWCIAGTSGDQVVISYNVRN